MTVKIGNVIDAKYKIVALLGEGGMGAVFEGMNTRIHRRVAIKVLHADVATNDEAMTRFEREAQAAGRIGSEHIVEVLDLGDLPGGERYMVMEFLDGESLRDRMARGPLPPREVATLSLGMLEGLKAAHSAGIVHRDLKPDNVFLLANRGGKKDFVKIVDFGISKFSTLGGEFSMTRTGAVMGTPYYMAPEQAKGGAGVDHRVDLYAVGVILYQAVVGRVPFDAETFNELLFKIVLETPPPLAERVPGLDPDFVAIVERGMAREAAHRFQTAQEFQDALRSWLGGDYIAAGRTIAGGTPALDTTALRPGAPMNTPAAGVSPSAVQPSTQGAWANTGLGGDLPQKKRLGWILWAGIGAFAVLSGGAALALSQGDADHAARAAREQSEAEERAAAEKVEEERKAALAALELERQKAEDAQKDANEARALAEKDYAELAAERRAEQERKAREETERAAALSVARRSAPRPRPPIARPASPPAPAPAPSGRPIRTDL